MIVKEIRGGTGGMKRHVAIVVSRWNELVTKELLSGAVDELTRAEANVEIVHVPGTWEMPPVVEALAKRTEGRPNAIVALGCILQGQTPHASLLSSDVAGALMSIQVRHCLPVAWGVLTPDDQGQALERAGLKMGNKGREAALAALDLISVMEQI